MKVYQLRARGSLVNFSGRATIMSKEIYTSPPTQHIKDEFRKRCIKCEGAADLSSLDPEQDIDISVSVRELVDNGELL